MKEKIKYIITGLTFRVVVSTLMLILLFECIVSGLGYYQFTSSLTQEYQDSAFRTASTAAALVDGDKIESYLQGSESDAEYQDILSRMNTLCQKQNVTLIYVIAVDTTDYNSFRSVFNTVNDASGYIPWPLGYERQTTNDSYRSIYQQIYENGLAKGFINRTSSLQGRQPHTTALIPIYGSDQTVKGILCVERPMTELASARSAYLQGVISIAVLLCILSTISAAGFLEHEFVTPMRKIHAETKRFSQENKPAAVSSLNDISKIREIEEVGTAFEKMEHDTQEYIQSLTRITAEKERIGTELSLAAQIQSEILPNTFPPFPDRHDFDLYACMTTAKEVGGDFYDFFFIDSDHLGLVMADVSGKGVPAALFMMMARLLLNTLAMTGVSPAEVLRRANEAICQNNKSDMFVTVWFGVLTLSTGKLTASSAGHEYPVIKRVNQPFEVYRDKHRLALGAMPSVHYLEYELTLDLGDVLFLYTDGVPEATNSSQQMLGTEGMLTQLNQSKFRSMKELLGDVSDGVTAFTGDAPQFDDITMMAICRTEDAPNDAADKTDQGKTSP